MFIFLIFVAYIVFGCIVSTIQSRIAEFSYNIGFGFNGELEYAATIAAALFWPLVLLGWSAYVVLNISLKYLDPTINNVVKFIKSLSN